MTADISEFPAMEQIAQILQRLDERRRRQVLAFLAEGSGWNLAPSSTRIAPRPNGDADNRSEFAAIEEATELLNGLDAQQQELTLDHLAKRFHWNVAASFKPPSKGFAPRRKRNYKA